MQIHKRKGVLHREVNILDQKNYPARQDNFTRNRYRIKLSLYYSDHQTVN